MATITQVLGPRTELNVVGLDTLANGNYVASDPFIAETQSPIDVVIEVAGSVASPSGNKQLVVFIKESLDGVNYRSGPESGSSNTDELNLRLMGSIPINSSSVQRGTFSVTESLGYVPYSFKIVFKNDAGGALNSGEAHTAEVFGAVA